MGDDGGSPACRDKTHRSKNLRRHRAFPELPVRKEAARCGGIQAPEQGFIFCAEPGEDTPNVGEYQEKIGAYPGGDAFGGEVLVDDRLDPAQEAVFPDHRDAPAAAGDDDGSCMEERSDRLDLKDLQGVGDGTIRRQPRPSSSRIAHPSAAVRALASTPE